MRLDRAQAKELLSEEAVSAGMTEQQMLEMQLCEFGTAQVGILRSFVQRLSPLVVVSVSRPSQQTPWRAPLHRTLTRTGVWEQQLSGHDECLQPW